MHKVAEELVGQRVVTEILDNTAPVSMCVRPAPLLVGKVSESFPQNRPYGFFPGRVDDGLVGQDGVSVRVMAQETEYI